MFCNSRAAGGHNVSSLCESVFGAEPCRAAAEVIRAWPGYRVTPLLSLPAIADELQLAAVSYKDEAQRFGLKSFKALGGAYAVFRVLLEYLEETEGVTVSVVDMLAGRYRDLIGRLTVASATAGNHGRSVAWGARLFGCHCKIFIHSGVGAARADAIAQYGAEIIRVDGNYDDSVAAAAKEHHWSIVSDTSYPGYTRIPQLVMQGYTLMLEEILQQSDDLPPTHILVQGGVGGLAAAVAGYFQRRYGAARPTLIVVEPRQADCLYQSARRGAAAQASGNLDSMMLGMACGEVSLLAWEILAGSADAFVRIDDSEVIDALCDLNDGVISSQRIVAGECSGAGLAALRQLAADDQYRSRLGLDRNSRVLLFGTEGDTDPQSLQTLLQRCR